MREICESDDGVVLTREWGHERLSCSAMLFVRGPFVATLSACTYIVCIHVHTRIHNISN
jgi:hypothetical protein